MDNWRYVDTGRIHGTKDPERKQPNYTYSKVYRYIWDEPEDEPEKEIENG